MKDLRNLMLITIILVLLMVLFRHTEADGDCTDCIQIGGLFDHGIMRTKGAFRIAMEQYNRNASSQTQVYFLVGIIRTKDAFKIAKLVCRQFLSGVWAMVASVEPDSFDTLHSYANTFQMPLVTPWFPENVASPSSGLVDYALSLRPDYHRAIIDIVRLYKWEKVMYIYESHEGLLRLQNLYMDLNAAGSPFRIDVVQRVASATDALNFLKQHEQRNRWSNKYIILDSDTEFAKELIVKHVQDIRMGRRNYHYLLSGLVMDSNWEEEIEEYGALNITGFRLVDPSRQFTRQFLRKWRSLDPIEYPGAGKYISARSALMYDAVRVLTAALNIFFVENPQSISQKVFHKTVCDLQTVEPKVYRYGESIARLMRKVKIEGLTGNISFTKEGRRKDFTIDIVEMTPEGEAEKIGSWSDINGFTGSSERRFVPEHKGDDRTLKITTIYEPPFIMMKRQRGLTGNDRFEGFIKDLIDHLASNVGFNYELHLVRDKLYGNQDDSLQGGWSGMIGEVVRKEADLAIGSLTITSARQRVIDFTKPFLATGISLMVKKPQSTTSGVFSFLAPISDEIWVSLLFAGAGVSIVLFLVSRFSQCEWKIVDPMRKRASSNDFTACNSVWFILAAFFHQKTELYPRSISGRIVSTIWWFFAIIIFSYYVANLAAFLTIERMFYPLENVEELSRQSEVEYGTLRGGSTGEFFSRSNISQYSRMWDFMSSRSGAFVSSYEEGVERVRNSGGKYAFLLETAKNDYVNGLVPCDTRKIGQEINTNGYGIAAAKGSLLIDALNDAIVKMTENGQTAQLKNKWWYERFQCAIKTQTADMRKLKLSNVAGLFYILCAGLVLALIVAVVEFCYKSKFSQSKLKINLSTTIKDKPRIITGSKNPPNIKVG